jgi:hypothetical protein
VEAVAPANNQAVAVNLVDVCAVVEQRLELAAPPTCTKWMARRAESSPAGRTACGYGMRSSSSRQLASRSRRNLFLRHEEGSHDRSGSSSSRSALQPTRLTSQSALCNAGAGVHAWVRT